MYQCKKIIFPAIKDHLKNLCPVQCGPDERQPVLFLRKSYQGYGSMSSCLQFLQALTLPELTWLDQADRNHICVHLFPEQFAIPIPTQENFHSQLLPTDPVYESLNFFPKFFGPHPMQRNAFPTMASSEILQKQICSVHSPNGKYECQILPSYVNFLAKPGRSLPT